MSTPNSTEGNPVITMNKIAAKLYRRAAVPDSPETSADPAAEIAAAVARHVCWTLAREMCERASELTTERIP